MYIVWLLLSLVAAIVFLGFEWYIADRMSKSIALQTPSRLPGKKNYYLLIIAGVSLISVTSLYLALSSYYGAPLNIACLSVGFIVAGVEVIVTSGRLKYVTFEDDEP